MGHSFNSNASTLLSLLPQYYYVARPPMPGDDTNAGYKPGDKWVDTSTCNVVVGSAGGACSCEVYELHDDAAGAAKWYSDESQVTVLTKVCDSDQDTCFDTDRDGVDSDIAVVASAASKVQSWLPNMDTELHGYPDTRDDGYTNTALYTDANGLVKHGPIGGRGVRVLKRINSVPTSFAPDERVGHWFQPITFTAGDVDLTPLNSTGITGMKDGDEVTFYCVDGGTLTYEFPLTGRAYEASGEDFITLKWDGNGNQFLIT